MLNTEQLRACNAIFEPFLKKYEDLCLTQMVLNNGGASLKTHDYAFRAAHAKKGGCEGSRNTNGTPTTLDDLIDLPVFAMLPIQRQSAIRDVLAWVTQRERQCATLKRKATHPPSV